MNVETIEFPDGRKPHFPIHPIERLHEVEPGDALLHGEMGTLIVLGYGFQRRNLVDELLPGGLVVVQCMLLRGVGNVDNSQGVYQSFPSQGYH